MGRMVRTVRQGMDLRRERRGQRPDGTRHRRCRAEYQRGKGEDVARGRYDQVPTEERQSYDMQAVAGAVSLQRLSGSLRGE